MEQNDYLKLSEDGKTVIKCRSDYMGAVVIPEGVTMIKDFVFFRLGGLTSIEIPASVTEIGGGAFRGCKSLTSIEIPDSMTPRLGNGPFLAARALPQ